MILAIEILYVRCLLCDKIKESTSDIFIPYEGQSLRHFTKKWMFSYTESSGPSRKELTFLLVTSQL